MLRRVGANEVGRITYDIISKRVKLPPEEMGRNNNKPTGQRIITNNGPVSVYKLCRPILSQAQTSDIICTYM